MQLPAAFFHCLCLHSRYMFILISSSTEGLTHLWSGLIVSTHSFKCFQFSCRLKQESFKIVSLCFSRECLAALQLTSMFFCTSEGCYCWSFKQQPRRVFYTANKERVPRIKVGKIFKQFQVLATRGHAWIISEAVHSVATRVQKQSFHFMGDSWGWLYLQTDIQSEI